MPGTAPPANFDAAVLDLATVGIGETWGRIYQKRFLDPLGFGKNRSRFSDPRRIVERNRFGVVYLGRDLRVCFVEAVLRDGRDAVIGRSLIDETELTSRIYSEIRVVGPLSLLDLRDDARIRQGVPSEVVGGRHQGLARRWSLAFFKHPQNVDGVIYPSRLNGVDNIALYHRAVPKLRAHASYSLDAAPGLGGVFDRYHVALAPPP